MPLRCLGGLFRKCRLIAPVDGEAQLAKGLAHERGHVAARHATKQATRGGILNFATAPPVCNESVDARILRRGQGGRHPTIAVRLRARKDRGAE